MIRIELKPGEREELERTFKGTPDRRLRDRCQAVLMADRGRRRGQIAEDLGVHRAPIPRGRGCPRSLWIAHDKGCYPARSAEPCPPPWARRRVSEKGS